MLTGEQKLLQLSFFHTDNTEITLLLPGGNGRVVDVVLGGHVVVEGFEFLEGEALYRVLDDADELVTALLFRLMVCDEV